VSERANRLAGLFRDQLSGDLQSVSRTSVSPILDANDRGPGTGQASGRRRKSNPAPPRFSLPKDSEDYEASKEKLRAELSAEYRPITVKQRACIDLLADCYAELSVVRQMARINLPPSTLTVKEVEILKIVNWKKGVIRRALLAIEHLADRKPGCENERDARILAKNLSWRLMQYKNGLANAEADRAEAGSDVNAAAEAASSCEMYADILNDWGRYRDLFADWKSLSRTLLGLEPVDPDLIRLFKVMLRREITLAEELILTCRDQMTVIERKMSERRRAVTALLIEVEPLIRHREEIKRDICRLERELAHD
jgi:hypothetical protein